VGLPTTLRFLYLKSLKEVPPRCPGTQESTGTVDPGRRVAVAAPDILTMYNQKSLGKNVHKESVNSPLSLV
jgi:hypothetical protein